MYAIFPCITSADFNFDENEDFTIQFRLSKQRAFLAQIYDDVDMSNN